MNLQSDDLTGLGIGIIGDQPPLSSQPVVIDGVHLRYAPSFTKGFPWYGFYLFRRLHRDSLKECLGDQLSNTKLLKTRELKHPFSGVTFHSTDKIEFVDEFPKRESVEIAFPSKGFLGATFLQTPVCRVVAKIGFRGTSRKGTKTSAASRPESPLLSVMMIARDGDVAIASTTVSGHSGDIVSGEIVADRISSIEFWLISKSKKPGPVAVVSNYAALVDMCWDTVTNAISQRGWARVPGYTYPMALPVAEPTYPCVNKPGNLTSAETLALSRIRYGNPSTWGGQNFQQLHATLQKLVVGGPSGGAMSSRTDTFSDPNAVPPDNAPNLRDENLLQLVQLASLDPAMAQMLGLYWVDTHVQPGTAYDYLIIADHSNDFDGNPSKALAAANGELPSSADAWIIFNQVAQPRQPLNAPAQPKAFVLPDTPIQAAAPGAVGLRWEVPSQVLSPQVTSIPVRYKAWRQSHGLNEPLTQPNSFAALNNGTAYLLSTSNTNVSAGPDSWPPFALNAVDRQLADGWYSYAVSGIDIWGRYSALSQSAEWRQWAPMPHPKPWYYQDPEADRSLHGFAVHILDKTPPPPPAAVEATALDPEDEDTYVRDAAYNAWRSQTGDPWWNNLTAGQRAERVPLRIRWRWYPVQQEQHPNTREFRIYFNPGSVAPEPDRFDPVNWQERMFVCDYNDHVTLVPSGTGEGPYRQYEVLLPVSQSMTPVFEGATLEPSLTQPIVYANISVSAADDKTHTDDKPKWNATPWGGRYGNESVLAAPSKIYRAWRQLPSAPTALNNNERVWATKADYHSRSFYTFRWLPSPALKAHVFSIMDATLFMLERTRLDITALTAPDLAALATIWNPTPPSIIDELAAFRALKASVNNDAIPALSDAAKQQNNITWEAACAALSDNALRGLASLPLHQDSYLRQTALPVDEADITGPDDPAGYVPNPQYRAWKATFDGRARNRYFLRTIYVDAAHNESGFGPPSPPIYLPPAVPPRTPVITKVTGGDRRATIAWTTANAEAGGSYTLYRTDNDYRLRDIRLMDVAATISSATLDPNSPKAEYTDYNIFGGHTYFYCLVFTDADGNTSAPSKSVSVFAPDERPPNQPFWTGQTWMVQDETSGNLSPWPDDGVVPDGSRPVLQLKWEASAVSPTFVISRGDVARPGWHLATQGSGVDYADSQPKEFIWIDTLADPRRRLQYRIRVQNTSGLWSVDFAIQHIALPVPPLSGP